MARKAIRNSLVLKLATALGCSMNDAARMIFDTVDFSKEVDSKPMTPTDAVNYLIAVKWVFTTNVPVLA